MNRLRAEFWKGFEKRAYQESSDELMNPFYRPDKNGVSPTQQWGVKLDMSLDQGDIAAEQGGMFSNSPGAQTDVYTGKG